MVNWIQFGAGALAAFMLSFILHTVATTINDDMWQVKLDTEIAAQKSSCAEDKRITQESSYDYQSKLNNLDKQLIAAKRLHTSKCVLPAPGQAAGGTTEAGQDQYVGYNAVNTDTLIDFAGQCEKYRQQVVSLQRFIENVWAKYEQ